MYSFELKWISKNDKSSSGVSNTYPNFSNLPETEKTLKNSQFQNTTRMHLLSVDE